MNPEWRSRYDAAVTAARQAGELALRYFDADVAVEWKQNRSPVTVADREAEQLLRKVLLTAFPDDAFLGEESGEKEGTTGYRWVIDPIDGTRSFVRGIPLWATLVALEYRDEQIAGVAEVPSLGHTYRALRGDGCYRNERRLRVSETAELQDAMLFYSSPTWFVRVGRERTYLDLAARCQRARGFGDFYGFVLLAQGSGEVMLDHGVNVWDVAALRPIVEEAGGRFTDWDGTPTVSRPDILATNGRLHDDVLRVLRGT